jgi:hypothetical protein
LGKGGCVFGSFAKRLERPHPKLLHWWVLVHWQWIDSILVMGFVESSLLKSITNLQERIIW